MEISLLMILIWFLLGIITSYLANQRGRDPYLWFAIGFLFGPFAILLVLLLRRHERNGSSTTKQVKPVKLLLPEETQEEELITKVWFFLDLSCQQHGPITFDSLKEHWENNAIDSMTFVWCEGMDAWKRIHDVPNLTEKLSAENYK